MGAQANLEAQIEKGMTDGEGLTFERMADQRPGMLPGSVILKIKAAKHNKFTRRGNDLHMEMSMSLQEALLGWTQTIRHIDGHTVEIGSNTVTKDRQVIKVEGEGMPLRDDPASFGDLYVMVNVIFPSVLTEEQRAGIENIFPARPSRSEL